MSECVVFYINILVAIKFQDLKYVLDFVLNMKVLDSLELQFLVFYLIIYLLCCFFLKVQNTQFILVSPLVLLGQNSTNYL